NISLDTLLDIGGKETNYAKYAVGMFPVALTSFGYHHSVCTMRVECQTKKEKTNTNTVEQIANVDEPKSIHGLIRFSSIPPDA
ncbi:aromatic amino acid transport family protein, partial [Haemophilus influenzae]|uniref:aromatic amino acid transport family protein n=1 Tax=Haemophilus influenzae TaxID=727 RepID=UPI0023B835BA